MLQRTGLACSSRVMAASLSATVPDTLTCCSHLWSLAALLPAIMHKRTHRKLTESSIQSRLACEPTVQKWVMNAARMKDEACGSETISSTSATVP